MRSFVSGTVTVEDLTTYFKGEHWRTIKKDGGVEGRSNSYLIDIKPAGTPAFAIDIHAYEDDSDRDEAVTDNPMKFLVDFLKTGTSGDEALQKMSAVLRNIRSMPPEKMASVLRGLATQVERKRIDSVVASKIVRRLSLMPDMHAHLTLLASAVKMASRENIETKEMQDLASKMTAKGWRVKTGKNDRGLPDLTVDIAGIYEAKIEIDHMPWKYSFEVHGTPATKVEGVTDDPIVEFRNYYHLPNVQTAKASLRAGEKDRAEKAKDEQTVAPKKASTDTWHWDGYNWTESP